MITLASIYDKVNEYKKAFYTLTHDVFLKRYVAEPTVDEEKLFFLIAMLSDKLPKKEIETYALTILLVDAAFNTHDKVSQSKINTDYVKKNRQLTVLAGDYFSSLYYSLLAKSGNLPMIRLYSATIQTINEHKMNLYWNKEIPYAQTKEEVSSIESLLLQNIAEHFQLDKWKLVIKEFFFLKRLLFERNEWEKGRKLPIIRSIIFENSSNIVNLDMHTVIRLCNRKIEESKKHLEYILADHCSFSSFVEERLAVLIFPTQIDNKVAEEG